MEFSINVDSEKTAEKIYGDVMDIDQFVECCKDGSFIDYDGFACELILDNKIVWEKEKIYPSDALFHKRKLLNLAKEYKGLKIVWYNG